MKFFNENIIKKLAIYLAMDNLKQFTPIMTIQLVYIKQKVTIMIMNLFGGEKHKSRFIWRQNPEADRIVKLGVDHKDFLSEI